MAMFVIILAWIVSPAALMWAIGSWITFDFWWMTATGPDGRIVLLVFYLFLATVAAPLFMALIEWADRLSTKGETP